MVINFAVSKTDQLPKETIVDDFLNKRYLMIKYLFQGGQNACLPLIALITHKTDSMTDLPMVCKFKFIPKVLRLGGLFYGVRPSIYVLKGRYKETPKKGP